MSFKKYLQIFLAGPARCIACGETIAGLNNSGILCEICRGRFNKELQEGCTECRSKAVLCRCKPKNFLPDELAYYIPYKQSNIISVKLINLCKKSLIDDLFSELVDCMITAYKQHYLSEQIDIITYVPRAPEKILKIGFDQARELGARLSAGLGIECKPVIKHRWLSSEQKTKSGAQRKLNADKMYGIIDAAVYDLKNKNVLLIDDVVTTGATVSACTLLIKKAGANKVFVLAAAKNVKKDWFDN